MTKTMIFAAVLLIAAGFSAPASAGGCCDGIPAPVKRSLILSAGEQPAETQAPASENAEAAADQQEAAPEAIAPASGEAQAAPAAEGSETPAAEAEAPAADEAQQPE